MIWFFLLACFDQDFLDEVACIVAAPPFTAPDVSMAAPPPPSFAVAVGSTTEMFKIT